MESKAIENPYALTLKRTLGSVRERIARAAERSGRHPESVRLVAVTKGHPVEAVKAALEAGVVHMGENRVDELAAKVQSLAGSPDHARVPVWHLIGHLQRRKVAAALGSFDVFHALDSLRLARRLSTMTSERGVTVRSLVQVNASGEETKGGFPRASALDALGELLELPGLEIEGLMTMAPFTDDEHIVRTTFARLRELHERARRDLSYHGTELSMGMTNDFEVGIEEGSTLVRLGTALFGERRND